MVPLISWLRKWNIPRLMLLDTIAYQFLEIMAYESYSAYEVKKYLTAMKTPLDYKNIHKRIKALHGLGLLQIDRDTSKHSIHGAIYYNLSELGVYYLVRKSEIPLAKYITITELFKKLLRNYKDNILLKTVLYPYFETDTILDLYGSIHIYYIWRYLSSCCKQIEKAFDIENTIQSGGEQIFIWNDVSPGSTLKSTKLEDKRLLDYLYREFHADWLKNAEITKFENDIVLKIYHRVKSITIELVEHRPKAYLKIDRKIVKELNVDMLPLGTGTAPWSLNVPLEAHEWRLEDMLLEIDNLAGELALSLVSLPTDKNDIMVLSRDEKFITLLKKTKAKFDKSTKLFLSIKS